MRPLLTAAQALELDSRTQSEFHISAQTLMETAGTKSAEKLSELFPDVNTRIGLLRGPGNNGGDGAVMARVLVEMGYQAVEVYPLSIIEKFNPENYHVVVDAVFGVGLNKTLSPALQSVAERILKAKAPVVAMDIPTGLAASTGEILGAVIKAKYTFTFGAAKVGHLIRSGPESSGKVFVIDIGFPPELREEIANIFRVGRKDVLKLLPQRSSLGNKTTFGKVKVWAGSDQYLGAGVLTARAAFRVGAGYVIWESEKKALRALEFIPELILQNPAPPSNDCVYAVGPGLGTEDETKEKIRELYKNKIERVVLDADALTVIAKENLKVLPTWVLTPHAGELSRLLGIKSEAIEKDRPEAVKKAVEKFGCTILLKGYHSLVGSGDKIFVLPTGNSALAKAGSGDVLTGMIAGLWAQGLSGEQAAIVGGYVHGWLADLWLRNNDLRGLTPSDLLLALPQLMSALYKS